MPIEYKNCLGDIIFKSNQRNFFGHCGKEPQTHCTLPKRRRLLASAVVEETVQNDIPLNQMYAIFYRFTFQRFDRFANRMQAHLIEA